MSSDGGVRRIRPYMDNWPEPGWFLSPLASAAPRRSTANKQPGPSAGGLPEIKGGARHPDRRRVSKRGQRKGAMHVQIPTGAAP
jgi:hypothetical protein